MAGNPGIKALVASEVVDVDEEELERLLKRVSNSMKKADLARELIAQRQIIELLSGGTTFSRQMAASTWAVGRIQRDMRGPDGQGGKGSIYSVMLEAALGSETYAYCGDKDCNRHGAPVACEDCGGAIKIEEPGDWRAAQKLMDYVIVPPSGRDAEVAQEYQVALFRIVREAFDRANTKSDPAERKRLFDDAVRDGLEGVSGAVAG